MLLYVSGAYTAPDKKTVKSNIRKAEIVAQQVLALNKNIIPIIPHKNSSFWDLWGELIHWSWADWMDRYCLPMLSKCDGIIMTPGWIESKGARAEFAYAEERRIPIYFEVEELRHV